jgi:formylglycine-generating enzyme required for sulfatase activity
MPKPQAGKAAPVHKVTFAKGFAMGAYPVTVAQFRAFVDATGYKASESCYTQHRVDGHFIYESVPGFNWRSPGFPQGDNYPVVCVSAEDGDAYAAWLSKTTGHRYSLPNEALYEYALRAGTTSPYFWGDKRDATACEYSNQPDLDQAAALGAPSGPDYRFQCHDGYAWTSPVGAYKPNPWGLYDMAGNIWEWTADCWNDSYAGAPDDGSTWTKGDCDARPSRGGSYGNAVFSTYTAIRVPRHASYVGHSWGFRVVRTD